MCRRYRLRCLCNGHIEDWNPKIIRRLLQHIFPLEVRSNPVDKNSTTKDTNPDKEHADSTSSADQSLLPVTSDNSNTGSSS